MQKKVLITGASGFVGRHLIDVMREQYQVIALTHSHSNPSPMPGCSWVIGDITDKYFLCQLIENNIPDLIIHLAAKTQSWSTNVQNLFDCNVTGTINVYEGVNKTRQKVDYSPKILYVSSSEVYGRVDSKQLINENSPMRPVNPYGASKAGADRLSYAYSQYYGLNIAIARPFTHTGLGQSLGFFVPDMASQIVETEMKNSPEKILTGNLQAVRDYTDVKDVVRAYKLLIEADTPPGEAFNVCSSVGMSMQQILEQLMTLSKKKLTLQTDPKRLRPSEIQWHIGDNSKIRELTGWLPKTSIEDTLEEVLDSWRGNYAVEAKKSGPSGI